MSWRTPTVVFVLVAAACVRADPAPPPAQWGTWQLGGTSPPRSAPLDMAPSFPSSPATAMADLEARRLDLLLQTVHLATRVPIHPVRAVSNDRIRPLPAPPDSASLFLYAAGTLGALQIGRSARKLGLGGVPVWLHTGAPAQVGHSVWLDPYHTPLLAAPALHATPSPDNRGPQRTWLHPPRIRYRSQSSRTTMAPRGPPAA